MRLRALATTVGIVIAANSGLASAESALSSPKIGSCMNYPPGEVQLATTERIPVNCKKMHNVEIYRVIKSPFKSDPNLEPPINLSVKVAPICEPGVMNSEYFTGWTFKVPTKKDWKSGARWLRCEAFVLATESETATFKVWRGKKLDFK